MKREEVKQAGSMPLLVRTYAGLESVLAEEIRSLGGGDAEIITRGVKCTGDLGFIYKLNLSLRCGIRVLYEVSRFRFTDNDSFYREVYALPWHAWFDVNKTFRIDSLLFSKHFKNSMFVSQLAKDALADRFRKETGKRPFVDTRLAQIYISIYVNDQEAVIYLDSSGESLHKRGYKLEQTLAPLSEVLAAGILKMSGWSEHFPLIDPMCGSGTFAIEAALMAQRIPPGIFRKGFSFEHWKLHEPDLLERIVDSVSGKIRQVPLQIMASDISRKAVEISRKNARAADILNDIRISQIDFRDYPAQERRCFLFLNPPYGERINPPELETIYRMIGSTLKHRFPGSIAWVLSAIPDSIEWIGLRPSGKTPLFNGDIECRLLRYEMYAGSKKNINNS